MDFNDNYMRKILVRLICLFFILMAKVSLFAYEVDNIEYTLDSSTKTAVVGNNRDKGLKGEIVIPKTITYDGITYIVISISNKAFYDNGSITSVILPSSITSIGQQAFQYCFQLAKINIPNSVETIGNSAFASCALEEITIPNGVKSIGYNAFGSTLISVISIPSSVEKINGNIVLNCGEIETIIVDKNNQYFDSRDNCNAIIDKENNSLIVGIKNSKIPDGIVSIGSSAFAGCGLTTITIPNSVTTIEDNAFGYNPGLTQVQLSDNLKTIGMHAFEECGICGTLSIPYGVTSIKGSAFKGCNKIQKLIIPNSVTEIEYYSFAYCLSLKEVKTEIKEPFEIDPGVFYSLPNTAVLQVPKGLKEKYKSTYGWSSSFKEIVGENTLTLKVQGNGEIVVNGANMRNEEKMIDVVEGSSPIIKIKADEGFRINIVKNDTIVFIPNYYETNYTINNIREDKIIEVEFIEDIKFLYHEEVNYIVSDYINKFVKVAKDNNGLYLIVPSSFKEKGFEWMVVGVEGDDGFNTSTLAAIVWNPETKFNGNVSNPNLLLYVKDKSYAPIEIKNVIVNGEADAITLTDAEGGNNFYCPQAFMAKNITYEHNYSMKSGYNVCQGWETIALPFDVGTISCESGEVLVPYASWSVGSSQRPFWLYSLASDGWKAETAIKANTPYIICMPNNEYYDAVYNIKGNVVFAASNVEIAATDNLPVRKSGDRSFVPNYQNQDAAQDIYALNVNNLWNINTDPSLAEGSAFIRDSRPVRPFEAYMTMEGRSSSRCIYIFGDEDEETTFIQPPLNTQVERDVRVYSLSGTLVRQGSDKKVLESLPKGVYIINGKKVVIK